MKFKLSPAFVIDTDDERVQKQGLRIAIIGESGSGKSWTIAVLSEQAKQQGVQVVFIDPHGEYHTFARVFEDVLVVGGENADLPLVEDAIDVYAEAYRMGKSLDFNLREVFTDEYEYGRIVEKILRALWKVQVNDPRPSIWNLEEAHMECPQEKSHDAMRRVGLVKAIATGGRKFGVILVLGTQRPAELHKTPLSQCWIRIFGKLTDKLDRNAVADYMKPVEPRELMSLTTSKFYVFGWFKEPTQVTIRSDRITEHGAETVLIKPIERKATSEKASIAQLKQMIEERLKKVQEERSETATLKRQMGSLQEELKSEREKVRKLETALEVAGKIKIEQPTSPITPTQIAKIEREVAGRLKKEVIAIFDRYEPSEKPTPKLDIYEVWESKMPSLCAKRMFKFLLDNKGAKYTKSQIGVSLGYKTSSGTFSGAITFLKQNSLIRYDGQYLWVE